MEIKGIKIKPGMIIKDEKEHIYIVFPTDELYKLGYGFVDAIYGGWTSSIPENIKTIYAPSCSTNICSGEILWDKERDEILEVTMDEVAAKFGVKKIRIK